MPKTQWGKTLRLWMFGFLKIPMIAWLRPRVIDVSDTTGVIYMPFRRRTKNHVNSMYFGALAVGAELAPGLLALYLCGKASEKIVFVFKDFSAEFFKRCEAGVYFKCDDGAKIKAAIDQAIKSKERQNVTLNVIGTIADEAIGKFTLTISLKALFR